jgi:hypothetical protein
MTGQPPNFTSGAAAAPLLSIRRPGDLIPIRREKYRMSVLEVVDLQNFVDAELPKLAKEVWPKDILDAAGGTLGCEVVGDDRGLVTSAVVGQSVFVSVGRRPLDSGQTELEYTRIYDRTADGIRAQLSGQLQALQHQIVLAAGRSS